VNSLYRNETGWLSSDLIPMAVAHTRTEWPEVPEPGIVSFIDAEKTRDKKDPGRCYREAGWEHVGFTKKGLYVFQQVPEKMPAPRRITTGQLELFGPGDWPPAPAAAGGR
jgi:hypothetical protein